MELCRYNHPIPLNRADGTPIVADIAHYAWDLLRLYGQSLMNPSASISDGLRKDYNIAWRELKKQSSLLREFPQCQLGGQTRLIGLADTDGKIRAHVLCTCSGEV